jgi:hypothetical protein
MEKLLVTISVSGYTGMTPSKIEQALNYYFGSMVDISVVETAQQNREQMETLAEFEKAVETLTPFQKRVLKAIERAPNELINTWEICWNDFAKEWNAKRSAHGAMFRSILQACQTMQEKQIVVILPPRDEHDTYTFGSNRKWYTGR